MAPIGVSISIDIPVFEYSSVMRDVEHNLSFELQNPVYFATEKGRI